MAKEVRLTLGLAELPTWLRLLPLGQVNLVDGRPSFEVDAESLGQVVRAFAARGTDLVIDYEHQSLKGGQAPAAGWIKDLEVREDGLWALVEWTGPAAEYIRRREYRYFSPVLRLDPESRRPLELVSVALTNTPAIQGLKPLVAKWGGTGETAGRSRSPGEGNLRDSGDGNREVLTLLEELRVQLGLGPELPETEVVRRTAELLQGLAQDLGLPAAAPLPEVRGYVAALKAGEQLCSKLQEELLTLRAAVREEEVRRAVEEAIRAGKISPAQKDWALSYCRQDPESFKAYVAKAPQLVPVGVRLKWGEEKVGGHQGLTPEEVALCRVLNLDPASYAEAKASLGQVSKGGGDARCQL